jgi:hypothetical protein
VSDVSETSSESGLDTCVERDAEEITFQEGCKESEVCGWSACEYCRMLDLDAVGAA